MQLALQDLPSEATGWKQKRGSGTKPSPPYSSLAQSVERMTVNHDVAGSSPAGGAKKEAERYCAPFSFLFLV